MADAAVIGVVVIGLIAIGLFATHFYNAYVGRHTPVFRRISFTLVKGDEHPIHCGSVLVDDPDFDYEYALKKADAKLRQDALNANTRGGWRVEEHSFGDV